VLLLSFFIFGSLCHSLPLSTNKRWIIDDDSGERVKLTCVNWAAHLQPMLAEGLDKKPLSEIVAKVADNKFNCVRLTWATYMFTRYGLLNVTDTLESLGLWAAREGIEMNNPEVLTMTLVQAYDTVVDELGRQGLMVVLDNHVSKPKWCCPYDDGNGFFRDLHFNPLEWQIGLIMVSTRYRIRPQVVAMSMRNELRGSLQNEHDWYLYIRRGAKLVHLANPDMLVVVSGLSWALDLEFLKTKPLALSLDHKLVYEAHWYSFSIDPLIWVVQPLNRVCGRVYKSLNEHAGFVMSGKTPVPLFLSEFGFDQRGLSLPDNQFLSCLMAYATEKDLDWGLWALQGSYYTKGLLPGPEEPFGLLDKNWDRLRYPKFRKRFHLMQKMIKDPNSNYTKAKIIFHPQSGSCVHAYNKTQIITRNCSTWSRWSHDGDGSPMVLIGSGLCLKVVGDGQAPILSRDCLSQQSAWKTVSMSKLHLAAKDEQGELLCLQKEPFSSSRILTRRCICIQDDSGCLLNPQSQWFKYITTNIK
ncbi:Cellulase domain-containing protein, partial [Cephalotus follicularis]